MKTTFGNFQVNTFGRADIKKMLMDVWGGAGGSTRDGEFLCDDKYERYWQFWEDGSITHCHNAGTYDPSTFRVLSINDYLEMVYKIKSLEIKLNDEYIAHVVAEQGFVTVGCQKIPNTAIRELVAAMDKLNCP